MIPEAVIAEEAVLGGGAIEADGATAASSCPLP
jgi:hypothetical protein